MSNPRASLGLRLVVAGALGLLIAGLGALLMPGSAEERNPMIQTEEQQRTVPPIDAAAPKTTETATFALG